MARHFFHQTLAFVGLMGLACTTSTIDDPDAENGTSTPMTSDGSETGSQPPKGIDMGDPPPNPELPAVIPRVETAAVKGFGDAADDPAIWVHPDDPAQSLIFASDKTVTGGIFVFGLDGAEREFIPVGEVNNVDLRSGFELGGRTVTLVTATNRTDDTLTILALDHETLAVTDVAQTPVSTAPLNYGLCMYKSPEGRFYSFVNTENGTFQQFELTAEDDQVVATLVREFCMETQPEGCVADDEQRRLFIGEESFGLWVFPAESDAPSTGDTTPACEGAIAGTMIASTFDGVLNRDVEGMGLAPLGEDDGYLIVSAQGQHEFVVFDRFPPYEHVLTFSVWGGGPSCIDGVEETDGLDVTTAAVGPDYPQGLLVVQDGWNGDPVDRQNFKLVSLADVFALVDEPELPFEHNLACNLGDYGGKARFSDLPPGPERTSEFCAAFCGKCEACYAEGDPGFSEGDCHYKNGKPNFIRSDCDEGCAAGGLPADTRPLEPGWEDWACLDLDDAL